MSFEKTTDLKACKTDIEEEREDKQTRRYDMLKLLSILKNKKSHSTRVKGLSPLTEKDGITGEELLKKLENGEWHVLYKREKIEN